MGDMMRLGIVLLLAASMRSLACFLGCRPPPSTLLDSEVPNSCAVPGLEVISWSREIVITSSNCNLEVAKGQFVDAPTVRYPKASPAHTYTLIMIDPDAPGMEPGEYWLHWIILNIKGSDFQKGYFDEADEIASYVAPGPPEGTGAHRYIFLAFEQSSAPVYAVAPAERPHFKLGPWLRGVHAFCGPRAGVQFRSPF